MNEESRPEAALNGSGGPAAVTRVADTTDKYVPHDCIESDLIWMLLAGTWAPPDTVAWRHVSFLVTALVQRKLVAIRPVLAHAGMWSEIPNRYDDMERLRDTYELPPKTPEQIRAQVKYSHAKWEREIAARAS
jgi:hypothetical protein